MKIIKKCLINYFKSLKYYLPAIGLLTIGLLIGIAGFLNKARNNVDSLINVMDKSVSESSTMNLGLFKDTVVAEFKNLPWKNIWEVLGTMFSKTFLESTITKGVLAVIGNDAYTEEITNEVNGAASSLSQGFVVFAVWSVIGILASYFYLKILIKKDLKMKVAFKKMILVIVLNYVLNISLVALATFLLGLFPLGAIITMIVTIFVNQAVALLEAYLSRTQESIRFKKIYTFKNINLLTLGSIIIALITVLAVSIFILISNQTIGMILSIPLYFILLAVISLNAYSYIKDYYSDLRP